MRLGVGALHVEDSGRSGPGGTDAATAYLALQPLNGSSARAASSLTFEQAAGASPCLQPSERH